MDDSAAGGGGDGKANRYSRDDTDPGNLGLEDPAAQGKAGDLVKGLIIG